jgi:hypothetical protein
VDIIEKQEGTFVEKRATPEEMMKLAESLDSHGFYDVESCDEDSDGFHDYHVRWGNWYVYPNGTLVPDGYDDGFHINDCVIKKFLEICHGFFHEVGMHIDNRQVV